jgi:hypothetical protein
MPRDNAYRRFVLRLYCFLLMLPGGAQIGSGMMLKQSARHMEQLTVTFTNGQSTAN